MSSRATEMLAAVHAHPGVTRAAAARAVHVGTGAATELVGRLSRAGLLSEVPAPPSGSRGRPTTVLTAHPDGPLVLAVEITHAAWRVDVVGLGGQVVDRAWSELADTGWPAVRALVTGAVEDLRARHGDRVQALGAAVPGTVSRDLRLDSVPLGWHDVDLRSLWPAAPLLVAANDATLAASAESRRGAATDAAVVLHLRVEVGLGGAVVDHGVALTGATGAGGEFGHMPFGDPAVVCGCGARGCWGTAVDGSALARLLGTREPAEPVAYARDLLGRSDPDERERTAVAAVAVALGRGTAGLVNGLDPDVVTLGGLGVDLLRAAPEELHEAYVAGLMAHRRAAPPPLVPAALGDEGPVVGAADLAWDALIPTLA